MGVIGKFGFALGDHLSERSPGVMLKMPFFGDDVRQKPIALTRIVDQLFKKNAERPEKQNIADVEHDGTQGRGRAYTGKAHVVGRRQATPSGLVIVVTSSASHRADSALARLEPAIRLVDHIGAPATANHAVVAVAIFEGLQRVANLHGGGLYLGELRAPRLGKRAGEVKTNAALRRLSRVIHATICQE